MAELSVIIPGCREWPVAPFTVRNIYEELRGRADFEILYVDNSMMPDGEEDRAYAQMLVIQRGFQEIKALQYSDKLSHWQAKNLAVSQSTGKFLFFVDAHCIVSRDALFNMLNYYRDHHEELNGTLHLPLTYHIMEYHKLIYKLAGDITKGEAHYSFTPYRPSDEPYQVPCMSTCGMMMTRELYDFLGGWPVELGIYGGGENFLNFCLAVTGKTVNIIPGNPLCHHGDKRNYSWNFDDHLRNKYIATYCFGGKDFLKLFMENSKGNPNVRKAIMQDVLNKCKEHRAIIKKNQVLTIQNWWASWRD